MRKRAMSDEILSLPAFQLSFTETCFSLSGGERFIQAEKNTAEFVAEILKRKGWGIERVKKHQKKSEEQKILET